MTAVLIGQAEPNTEPWYEMRRAGIGGSEIAGVVGLSRYMSPFWLWHFKKGNLAPQRVSAAMEWGHRLEPVVREWWAEQHPELRVNGTPGTYAHSERDWQRCNPDGLIFADETSADPTALYEGKTARFDDGWGKSGTADVPMDYMCQIQWQLDIFGLERCYVAVLFGGSDPREYVIDANPTDQAFLREKAEAFWNSIQNDQEPPLDATDHTYQAVVELNPDMQKDEFVDLDPELWTAFTEAKSRIDEANSELTFAKSQILHAMRGVQYAHVAGTKVLRRQRHPSGSYYLKETA